jgi:hypothetical protein
VLHLHIIQSQTSVLLVSQISLRHIVVASWVPSCILPGTPMARVNRQGDPIPKIVLFILCAMSVWSHYDSVYSSCYIIQENIISDHADNLFRVGVLTPLGDVVPDVAIWESSFPFWVSDQVAEPRRSSNGAQSKESHETQFDSTRCYVTHAQKEMLYGKPRSFPPFNGPNILLSPWSMYRSSFLVLPPS